MPRYRMTLSGPVQLTEQEEGAIDAEAFQFSKTAKIAELKSAFDAENYADIDYDSKTWRADKASQQLLSDVLAPGSVPIGMYWRDAAETQHAMTFADLQALGRAMLDRGLVLDNKFETKKAAVIAAESVAVVNAITWEDE